MAARKEMEERRKELLRNLPKIDEILLILQRKEEIAGFAREIVRAACRASVDALRAEILRGGDPSSFRIPTIAETAEAVAFRIEDMRRRRLRRVINATGIIIHTNLGRAPLCRDALERIQEVGEGYSNLEFDLAGGRRGLRYDHVADLLCSLTGAEDALVVNNNAAAVLLVLNTLARNHEAVVSRGELIEIGGEFRIPDVMERSGAQLREVGTTNRTNLKDYEEACGDQTALILKVHTSNYRIVGFTEEVGLADLAGLAKKRGVPVMSDLGSGCLVDLAAHGLEHEPTVQEVLAEGADVVTFSGDKLLGGPQAGVILGRKDLLERMKKNPLTRALRIDKFTLAALEATLIQYLRPGEACGELPVLRALTEPAESVLLRAKKLARRLRKACPPSLSFAVRKGTSLAGGGSLPTREIPTSLVTVRSSVAGANELEKRLRRLEVPIVARISDDELLLDLRTISAEEFPALIQGFVSISSPGGAAPSGRKGRDPGGRQG